jgi:hypothetical protein
MGKAFGGSFANIYMGEWESSALASSSLRPSMWLRYQDDILFLWDHPEDRLHSFLTHLNAQDPNIQLQLESSASSIRFLDLELFRDGEEVGYRVAFKHTDSHLALPRSSHHPAFTHRGVLYSQVLRWAALCKHREDFLRARATVFPLWRAQGVTRTTLRNTLQRVYATTCLQPDWEPGFTKCKGTRCGACFFAEERKTFRAGGITYPILHHLTCATRGCVYAIFCTECNIFYVGQSGNPVRQRLSEHLRSFANPDVHTLLSHHFRAHGTRTPLKFFALEHCPSKEKRLAREAVWIRRFRSLTPHGLNSIADSTPRVLNLVTTTALCTSTLNAAIRKACEAEAGVKVRFAYRTDKNLRRHLF